MKSEIAKLLDGDCSIIFDTNVYLNLYEYSPQIADFFIEITSKVSSKIVIPNTVKREFDRNHKECHGRQKRKFDNVPAVLKKSTDQMEDKISKQFSILKNFQFPSRGLNVYLALNLLSYSIV